MSEPNSHGYQHGYKQVSHHEWRTAENSAAYVLPHLQQLVKQKPNLKMLDIGAGSGTITASLAKYMPAGHITAVDLSDEILSKARAFAAKQGVTNITTQEASVYELSTTFGEHSFDVVHTSQMLIHLDDPGKAVQQMLAVCKPGGIVAIREAIFELFKIFPETPTLKHWNDALLATHQGSRVAGLELLQWGLAAGATTQQMTWTVSSWAYWTAEEKEMWRDACIDRLTGDGTWKKIYIAGKQASADEVAEMAEGWKDWEHTNGSSFVMPCGELIIKKSS